MRAQTLEIQARDLDPGMRLIIMPDNCPVVVLVPMTTQAKVRFPNGDEFTVPVESLRRIGSWREAGRVLRR